MLLHPGPPRPLYQLTFFDMELVFEALHLWGEDKESVDLKPLYKGFKVVESQPIRTAFEKTGILMDEPLVALEKQSKAMYKTIVS